MMMMLTPQHSLRGQIVDHERRLDKVDESLRDLRQEVREEAKRQAVVWKEIERKVDELHVKVMGW